MAFSALVDLVKVTSTTSGQGALTLGPAVSGFLNPSTVIPAMSSGSVVSYGIADPSSGNEVGQGILTLTGSVWTLTRGVTQSSNAGAPINCTGQAVVALTLRAEDVLGKDGTWITDPGVDLTLLSGDVAGDVTSGFVTIGSGAAPDGHSAGVFLVSGDAPNGFTGTVHINSGDAGLSSGDIKIAVGATSGTPGNILMPNLPTSTVGLQSGSLWNNGGVLCIV